MHKCAVFLDRDGTINLDKGYVHRIEDWEWIPGAINAIVALKKAGYLVVIITNQAGIARGLYGKTDMIAMHIQVNDALKLYSVEIDGFYHCPHHPEFGEIRECECRKPKPGMIMDASREFNIDLSRSWLIGDKASDIHAGLAAGVKSILVLTGYGSEECDLLDDSSIVAADIEEASSYILSHN